MPVHDGTLGMECPFCSPAGDEVVISNDAAYVRYDRYPVSQGHMLVIPRRHISSYLDCNEQERIALWNLVDEARKLLDREVAPDGYNIGINIGEAGGQTVMHMHIHLIPRFHGDMEDPRGGVRGVIPDKMRY